MLDEINEAISGRVDDKSRLRRLATVIAASALAAGALLVLVIVLATASPAADADGDSKSLHVMVPTCQPYDVYVQLFKKGFREDVILTRRVDGRIRVLFSGPFSWSIIERLRDGVDWFCIVATGKGPVDIKAEPEQIFEREQLDFNEKRGRVV